MGKCNIAVGTDAYVCGHVCIPVLLLMHSRIYMYHQLRTSTGRFIAVLYTQCIKYSINTFIPLELFQQFVTLQPQTRQTSIKRHLIVKLTEKVTQILLKKTVAFVFSTFRQIPLNRIQQN